MLSRALQQSPSRLEPQGVTVTTEVRARTGVQHTRLGIGVRGDEHSRRYCMIDDVLPAPSTLVSRAAGSAPATTPSPLRSIHTSSFAELLDQLGISVIVSTYQAGYVVVLRHDGAVVNTHFRSFDRPMGLAVSGSRLAVGGAREITQYRNMPALAGKVAGPQPHDACYLPREVHVTGDIDIHEMAFGKTFGSERSPASTAEEDDSELWLINTRFSCLCTVDREHSFVPRWRPGFVSGLSPQDRCHLNGMAMVDGRPRYVTALGESDAAAGWRDNKARGGVLIDIDSGETVARGLSMPHSPRWYNGKLWLAESGDGSLGVLDLDSGRYEAVGRLDGFTRGLDFLGPFAFVGVSQVRESAFFSGIPITDRLNERICGVSVLDLRDGREVAFVRFEDAVQEIFAVQVVPHRFPEILEFRDNLLNSSFALPEESLKDVSWVPSRKDECQDGEKTRATGAAGPVVD